MAMISNAFIAGLFCAVILIAFDLYCRRRSRLRAAAGAAGAATPAPPIVDPTEWRDQQVRRDVERLCREIHTEAVVALARMIAMAEAVRAVRLAVDHTTAEEHYRRLVCMANRVRANRRRMTATDLHQLIEAVVRYCAERLEVFPLENAS